MELSGRLAHGPADAPLHGRRHQRLRGFAAVALTAHRQRASGEKCHVACKGGVCSMGLVPRRLTDRGERACLTRLYAMSATNRLLASVSDPGRRKSPTVADPPSRTRVTEAPPSRRRVLVAEDDEGTREMYAWCMRAAGWVAYEAANGQEALEMAVTVRPNIIVMDLRMPELDGLDAIARLKADERTKGIPVVACTALDRLWAEARAKQVRCDAFVAKPCSPDDLLALLEDLVEGAGESS